MLTLARWVSASVSGAPISAATGFTISRARSRLACVTVNVRSVSRSTLAFWTIVSTLMPASASGSNRRAAMPGWSGTPRRVMRATSVSSAIPETLLRCSIMLAPPMRVPGASLKLEATRMGTL